jgi:hypothetical protein
VKDWRKHKLPIPYWDGEGNFAMALVKAWYRRPGCVAIRKRGQYGVSEHPGGDWVVFYIPTGYSIATARTRAEAKQMALAIEPLLAGLNQQAKAAVKSYTTACYQLRTETPEDQTL